MLKMRSIGLIGLVSLFGSGAIPGAGAVAKAAPVAGAPAGEFVAAAVEAYLGRAERSSADLAVFAAATLLDFRAHPRELGALWVEEIVTGAGESGFRKRALDEAAFGGETASEAFSRLVTEMARHDGRALLRTAARLHTVVGSESGPSRLRMFDLEAGALDAAPPPPMTVRHRSFVPEGETDALVLSWPPDGGDGAAVVRYADGDLPADVVFFSAGERRTVPLSGVARVDFLVAGSDAGTPGLRIPVECTRSAGLPFARLEARADASGAGPRLTWSTTSHQGLRGWAIFREEVRPDGRIVRIGPEMVPSSESADESFGYAFVDTAAAPETFYRYTVWAVTEEGLLARAFTATLENGRARRGAPTLAAGESD
jgi:hypothetical protein